MMDYAAFIPVVLNSSNGEEHSRGQGEEEGRDVAGGDGKAGPLDNLTKIVGGRDVFEETSTRDAVHLLTVPNAFRWGPELPQPPVGVTVDEEAGDEYEEPWKGAVERVSVSAMNNLWNFRF